VNQDTTRKTVTSSCRRHKILVISDSHVRDLSEKISNCLDNSFSVTGITKSNGDIEAITSLLHLKTENLTKEDLIIFCGGTKDISRNEAKKRDTLPKGVYTKDYECKCYLPWSPLQI
jgi:predicted phosphodiesterase